MTQLEELTTDPLSTTERLTAAAGAAFVGCILVGNSMTESVVGVDESPEGTAADLLAQGSSTVAQAGLVLELVGLLLLAVFAAGTTSWALRRGATVAGMLVALSASVVVAVKLASAAPYLAALGSAEELDPELLQALVSINDAAFVVTWLPFAVLVGSLSLVLRALGHGRVLAGTGAALAALGLVAGAVGAVAPGHAVPVPFLLSLLWTAAAALRLATRG